MRPTAAQHPSAAELTAFALGQLDHTTIDWVSRHLDDCSACRSAVENTPSDSLVDRLREATASRAAATASWVPEADTRGELPPPAPAAGPDDLPPALRDHPKYRILGPLGRGGMGVVYQAEHRVMERLVAVKVINRALLVNPEVVERFHREILRAAAKLDHPNIVKAYDAEQAGDLQLLAMEFVQGQSLADYLKKKGPLPVAHACHYARQAALGLQHAHERGMVHRDIKPHNLIRTPQGVVKILDFGLAKLLSERPTGAGLTSDNAMMGTPEFIAPEQAQDTKSADIRADIYALGCTLFCLLAGRPPFIGGDWLGIVMAHVQEAPPSLESLRPDVPAGLAALVARMLAKDPAQRPQTPQEVAEALAPFVKSAVKAGEALAVAPAGRRRWLVPAGVALGVVLAGAAAVAVVKLTGVDAGVSQDEWPDGGDTAQPVVPATEAAREPPPVLPAAPKDAAVALLGHVKKELLKPRYDAKAYRQGRGKTVSKDKADKVMKNLDDQDRQRIDALGKLDKAIHGIEQGKTAHLAELLDQVRETTKQLSKRTGSPNIQTYLANAEWYLDAALTKLREANVLSP